MEARPRCHFCRRLIDPSDAESVEMHEASCMFAGLARTVSPQGRGERDPNRPPLPYKSARPKRRKRSSFK